MKRIYTPALRITSLVVLFFFSWTFGGLADIAYAVKNNKKLSASADQPKAERPEEKFTETLDEILEIVQTVQAVQTVEEKKTEKEKLKAKKQKIAELDKEIRKQFKDTEKKLKDAKLPAEILQRHYDFVKQYEDNLNELKTNLDDIEKAEGKVEIEAEVEKTKKHLEKVKPKKKHTPLDPNKLPHRTPEVEKKEPRTKPEEFQNDSKQLAVSSNKSKSVLVASNGSLEGLLSKNSEYYNFPLPSVGEDWSKWVAPNSELQNFQTSDLPGFLLAQANPPTADDLAETIEVQFTPEIEQLAANLGYKPVKIYQYVGNNFEYEPYYGSLKGAQQTLLERAGNDFDQASLLITLLRASNIPARYVYGTVEIPIEDIKNWLGIDDTNMVLTALSSSGIPLMAMTSGGEVVSVQLEHVWCQAYVPYIQSRGALEGEGDMWIDMDPSFKSVYTEVSEDIELPSFNQSQYLADIKQDDPIVVYESDLQAYLDTIFPDRTTGAVKIQKEIEQLWFEFLLGTLPYDVIVSTTFTDIPNSYRYTINLSVTDDETEIFGTPLTYNITIPELAGKRISLSYGPATDADSDLINQYGDLYSVPAYLLHLKPEIRIDGEIKASGSSIGFGKNQTFGINFKMPYGKSDNVNNIVTAGGYYVTVLNMQRIPEHQVLVRTDNFRKLDEILQSEESVSLDDYAGEILHLTGLAYFQKLDAANRNAGNILKVIDIKGISEATVSIDVMVEYVFNTPVSVSLSGIGIDVDRDVHLPIPVDGDMNKMKEFMTLSGITSSFFEHKVLEDIYDTESVSAVKIIQTANERGIPVYTINSDNISSYIDSLQVSSDVKTNVINAVNAGKEVIIPQQEMQINDWIGTGYIVTNPETGTGAYMISGGLAGAVFSVWSLNIPYSYNIPPSEIANSVNKTLSPNFARFPGKDDEWFTADDKIYPLIDLIRIELSGLPEEERDNYRDPNPDRGDSGLIKIDETNENDYIASFLQLKEFDSISITFPYIKRRAPYLRLHPSLIYALQVLKRSTGADTVTINHGYRTVDHYYDLVLQGKNPAKNSFHMDGMAADVEITIPGKTAKEAYNELKEDALSLLYYSGGGGVGCYAVHIHIDTRGTPEKWGCK